MKDRRSVLRLPVGTCCLVTLIAAVLAPSNMQAGFQGPGITPVPITEGGIDKDALDAFDQALQQWMAGGQVGPRPTYPPFEDVPAARIAQLKQFPPFDTLPNDAAVVDKVREMRRALACAIELVGRDDPAIGLGLQRLLRLRKICFGLTRSNISLGAAIFPDGKSDFGPEPINIYSDVGASVSLTDVGLFVLYNSLSHEGLHAVQNIRKPTGPADLADAVDLQCREIEAHEGETRRIDAMLDVLSAVERGMLPADARGAVATFGARILAAPNRAQIIRDWRSKLAELKARNEQFTRFRQTYKMAGEAALAGSADAAAIRTQLRRYGNWFQLYSGNRDFRAITTHYFPRGTPIITGEPGSRRVENSEQPGVRQIIPPSLEPVDIPVMGLDAISDIEIDHANNVLYFGGVRFGAGAEPDLGILCSFALDPVSGAILPESSRLLVESPALSTGFDLALNPWDLENPLYCMKRGPADICRFVDTDADGAPDTVEHRGSLPQGGEGGLAEAATFLFIGEDVVCGYPSTPDTVPDIHQPICRAERTAPDGPFSGRSCSSWKNELRTEPTIAGLPYDGRLDLPCSGTPNAGVEVFFLPAVGAEMKIGEARFDWCGDAIVDLAAPIDSAYRIQLRDELGGVSPAFVCAPAPGELKLALDPFGRAPGFDLFTVVVDNLPGQPFIAEHSSGLGAWGDAGGGVCDAWGSRAVALDVPHGDGVAGQGFLRFAPAPFPDPVAEPPLEFSVVPGVPTCLDLGVNDVGARPGEWFDISPPALHPDLFRADKTGKFTVTLLTFGGEVTFTYRRMRPDGEAGDPVTVLLTADTSVLRNPPTHIGENGVEMVTAVVLGYEDRTYPLYQLVLANNPLDECKEPHWHAFDPIFSLQDPVTAVPDPAPPTCGFGRLAGGPPEEFIIPKSQWDAFLALHP